MSLLLFIQELLISYKTKPQFHFEFFIIYIFFPFFLGHNIFDIFAASFYAHSLT